MSSEKTVVTGEASESDEDVAEETSPVCWAFKFTISMFHDFDQLVRGWSKTIWGPIHQYDQQETGEPLPKDCRQPFGLGEPEPV